MPASEAEDAKTYVQRLRDLLVSHQFRKLLRYSAVSLVFVPLGQAFVYLFHQGFGINEVVAVLLTSAMLTPPNYLANKNYVWRHKAKDNMRTEITVFWVAAVLGTGFASGFVFLAGQVFPEADGKLSHNIAIFFAQLVGFGIVWVARFIFLDKLIFKATHHEGEPLKPANAAAE